VLFSVIIPTYNRLPFLLSALTSVRAQRFRDFEVVVVDDGSTDGTAEALKTFGMPLTLLRHDNRGPGAARNSGAREARGDYLAFLDSDDLWFPWTLATFARLIAEHGEPTILSAHVVEFRDASPPDDGPEGPVRAAFFDDYLASSQSGHFVGAGMTVVRRERFLETGGFTDRRVNCEDHDLVLRLGVTRGFVQVLSPPTLAWRRHGAAATTEQARSAEGSLFLIEQERRGAYPGGPHRAAERRRIVTLHTRPVSLACLAEGRRAESWRLYRKSFRWHVAQGRWKYLLGFPLKALTP
jgi:GT2 family glycosyltransferase